MLKRVPHLFGGDPPTLDRVQHCVHRDSRSPGLELRPSRGLVSVQLLGQLPRAVELQHGGLELLGRLEELIRGHGYL